jgi:hypothetical protein
MVAESDGIAALACLLAFIADHGVPFTDRYSNSHSSINDITTQACRQAPGPARAGGFYTRELIGGVQQRVESRRSAQALLLPPLNSHLKEQRAKDAFCELTRGARAWANAMPEGINPEMFDRQRLPDFLGHQETQVIYKDTRGVVFPCCRASEPHGGQEFDHSAKVELLRDLLQSTYRFGASLPPGFHHDAQFEGGRDFKATPFECSRNGQLSVSATHANIYPNDYVLPAP